MAVRCRSRRDGGMIQVGNVPSDDVLFAVAERRFRGPVEHQDAALSVDRDDRVERRVEHGLNEGGSSGSCG